MKFKKNYILYIGLGDWNISQLEMAKSYNFNSIVINQNKNSLALKNSDVAINCDSRNYKKIYEILKKKSLDKKIKYVYTGSEFVYSTACLAKKLKIKWHSIKSAMACEDKNLQKKVFLKNKILSPKFKILSEFKQLKKDFFLTKKIIFKPTDGHASKGVKIVDKKKDHLNAFNFSKKFSVSGKVIVEEYIYGTLHDINAMIIDNKFYRLGISDKTATAPPHAVIKKIETPTKLSISDQKKMYKIFHKSCKSLNLNQGPVKGDYIRDKNGRFYLMEVSARFHGPLSTLYAIPNTLKITPFIELLRYLSKKRVNEHKIIKNYENRTLITADTIKKERQISLKKKGKLNKKKWTSNYDVPIYNIKLSKLKKNTNSL